MGAVSAPRRLARALPASQRGISFMPLGWHPLRHPEMSARWRVTWESVGPAGAPVLVVLGGISADRHVTATREDPRPGWWNRQVGPGLAINPARWRVVSLDFLAGSGQRGAVRSRLHLVPEDQADAVFAVLDHLGTAKVHAVVGSSYGGSVALAASLRHPERIGRLVMLAAAHRSHPHATALRLVQRGIVEMALANGSSAQGLALARALAFTTYRTAGEFDSRFAHRAQWKVRTGKGNELPSFEVSSYLDNRGEAFAGSVDPEAFLTLSESIDLCDLDPTALRVPAYLISFSEDTLVPPWLVGELEAAVPGTCCHFRLNAKCGHDGFLTGAADLSAALSGSLATWPDEECRP